MQFEHFDVIAPDHKHIYLSPHFDDVVYSCGGLIGLQGRKGEAPLVITIFAGIPPMTQKLTSFARRVQQVMGVGNDTTGLIALRQQEDIRALTHLQASYFWCDYLDAIYRGAPAFYRRKRSISGKVHSADTWIARQLVKDLVTLHERLPDANWYAPLGLGKHVDHQIIFAVADHLLWHGVNVKFYEDFPYARNPRALNQRLKELGNTLKPLHIDISETLNLRQEAATMYYSQVVLNFGDQETMHQALNSYAMSIHPQGLIPFERYWTHHSK